MMEGMNSKKKCFWRFDFRECQESSNHDRRLPYLTTRTFDFQNKSYGKQLSGRIWSMTSCSSLEERQLLLERFKTRSYQRWALIDVSLTIDFIDFWQLARSHRCYLCAVGSVVSFVFLCIFVHLLFVDISSTASSAWEFPQHRQPGARPSWESSSSFDGHAIFATNRGDFFKKNSIEYNHFR